MCCPLTHFPIALLPYPPFKFRVYPKRSSPSRLVDGKSLAMQIIVSGCLVVCHRELEPSDIEALDQYVHRCKLGPFRPSRALELSKRAVSGQHEAAKELQRFRAAARTELGKLRRIQENRLHETLTAAASLPDASQAACAENHLSRGNQQRSVVS